MLVHPKTLTSVLRQRQRTSASAQCWMFKLKFNFPCCCCWSWGLPAICLLVELSLFTSSQRWTRTDTSGNRRHGGIAGRAKVGSPIVYRIVKINFTLNALAQTRFPQNPSTSFLRGPQAWAIFPVLYGTTWSSALTTMTWRICRRLIRTSRCLRGILTIDRSSDFDVFCGRRLISPL